MGQAKARGTYEQRFAEGCARVAAEDEERRKRLNAAKELERQRRANLLEIDPKKYEREKHGSLKMQTLISVAAVMMLQS